MQASQRCAINRQRGQRPRPPRLSATAGLLKSSKEPARIFGLNMLVFDPQDCLIQQTVGFRQLFPNERAEMLKAGPLVGKGTEE